MTAPVVISPEQWQEICNVFLLLLLFCWLMSINWTGWYDRIEWLYARHRRRQRLAFIRNRKARLQA